MSLTRKNKSQNKHKTRICLAHPQSSPEWPRKHKSLFIFLFHFPGSDYSFAASKATWREKRQRLASSAGLQRHWPSYFLKARNGGSTDRYREIQISVSELLENFAVSFSVSSSTAGVTVKGFVSGQELQLVWISQFCPTL